jgi:cysteine synthase A
MTHTTKITDLIGNTQIVQLNRLWPQGNLFAKIESANPGFSIKDRISLAMVEAAEKTGHLTSGGHIVEATSGNTGVGLAMVAASRGYRLTLVMPENMSIERRKLIQHLGGEVVLTPKKNGMKGAVLEAEKIANQTDAWQPKQFENPINRQAHYEMTGPEIWQDLGSSLGILVAGVGTGGTLSGAGAFLKEQNPGLRLIAVEPAESPVLGGGQPSPHKIQGIGAGFVPVVLQRDLIDGVEAVTFDRALAAARQVARVEGLLVGISGGAALAAGLRVVEQNPTSTTLTILPDSAERYLSTELFDNQ